MKVPLSISSLIYFSSCLIPLTILCTTGLAQPGVRKPKPRPNTTTPQPPARKPATIYRLDKTTVEAFVTEIDDRTISYRKASNPDGPVYKVQIGEVEYIRYANGEVEQYSKPVASRPEQPHTPPSRSQTSIAPPADRQSPVSRPADSSPGSVAGPVPRSRRQTATSGLFLTAGIGSGAFQLKSNGDVAKYDGVSSYRLGIGYMRTAFDLGRAGKVLVGPSLEYVATGGYFLANSLNIKTKVNFVTLTGSVLYESPVLAEMGNSKLNAFVGFGLSVGYALGGTVSAAGYQSEDIEFTKQTGDGAFVRLQVGLGGQVGVRYGRVSLFGYHNWTSTDAFSLPANSSRKIIMLNSGAGVRFHF